MLDVHPPHAPTHTWRDFLIHIATIVVGLIIAVGLEQTVEYLHHRHQVHELREALRQEREENRKIYLVNVAQYRVNRATLENDLRIFLYLRQHPGTPEEKLPGIPSWAIPYEPTVTAAWKNAQQTQTLSLLSRQENEEDAQFYDLLDKSEQAANQAAVSAFQVGDYAFADPDPSHLTPAQVEKKIEAIQDLMYTNWGWAVWLGHLGDDHQDFAKNILSWQEVDAANPSFRSAQDKARLAAAAAQTQQTLAAAMAALKETHKTTGVH
jgi:hypothetical protein